MRVCALLPLIYAYLCNAALDDRSMTHGARRVFIMRHGLKEDNYKNKVNFDVKLHAEAGLGIDAVRKFLHDRAGGQTFGRVISSPFIRARDTAARLVPGAEISIDPGLSECLEHWAGLKGQLGEFGERKDDPSVVVSQLEALKPQFEQLLKSQLHVPLVQVADLQPDDDYGCKRLSRVAWELKKRQDLFEDGPVLLVSHGSPAFCMIEALLDSTNSIIPAYENKPPAMASVTELVEQEDGTWHLVGNASPVKSSSGLWEVKWTAGVAAAGGSHTDL